MNKIVILSGLAFFTILLAMQYQQVDARQGFCHVYGIGAFVLEDTCTGTEINCKDLVQDPIGKLTIFAFIDDKSEGGNDSSVKVSGECFEANRGPGTGIMLECKASAPTGGKDTCSTQRVGISSSLRMQCTYELQGVDDNDLWYVSCGGLPQ